MTLEKFFFDTPLYTKIRHIDPEGEFFRRIFASLQNREEFEGYNPHKRKDSTFVVEASGGSVPIQSTTFYSRGGIRNVRIKCKRSDDVFEYFIFWMPESQSLLKVGQHPSVADFHISEIKQYKKLLPEQKLGEFTRAIGLAANGIGIGSFVYLRRIFEHLIREAYEECLKEGTVAEEEYQKARMEDKIKLTAPHLPEFLVQNKTMYSILSLGVHELNEDECLAHFDTLRVGIELILDEKLNELKKAEKLKDASIKLSQLKGKVKDS